MLRRNRLGGDSSRGGSTTAAARGARREGVFRAGDGGHPGPERPPGRPDRPARSLARASLALAEEFVGCNVNDEGYLVCSVQEIVDGINTELARIADESGRDDGGPLPLYTLEEAERMLARIQDLEPPGVGARDLRECLMLQLRQAGLEQSVPYRLVRDCFDELINHRWSEISKRFAISQTEVQRAADEIAKLDPKPGLVYSSASDNYITPDLVVDKIDGRYHVFLNDANLPRLKLSRAYQEDRADKEEVRRGEQGVHLQQAQLDQLDAFRRSSSGGRPCSR